MDLSGLIHAPAALLLRKWPDVNRKETVVGEKPVRTHLRIDKSLGRTLNRKVPQLVSQYPRHHTDCAIPAYLSSEVYVFIYLKPTECVLFLAFAVLTSPRLEEILQLPIVS